MAELLTPVARRMVMQSARRRWEIGMRHRTVIAAGLCGTAVALGTAATAHAAEPGLVPPIGGGTPWVAPGQYSGTSAIPTIIELHVAPLDHLVRKFKFPWRAKCRRDRKVFTQNAEFTNLAIHNEQDFTLKGKKTFKVSGGYRARIHLRLTGHFYYELGYEVRGTIAASVSIHRRGHFIDRCVLRRTKWPANYDGP
jgi:hypothetical protein